MSDKSIPLNMGAGSNEEKPAAGGGSPIQFFDSSFEVPKAREDVRFNQVGFFVYEDQRRVAVGFDITKFLEGPSIEVNITNDNGEPAGTLTVVETNSANFSLTMHLRDKEPTDLYHVKATLYYNSPDDERMDVYTHEATIDVSKPGEQR